MLLARTDLEHVQRITDAYLAYLESKIQVAEDAGFRVDPEFLHPSLRPHQRDAIVWALRLGRALLAESFGMGKTRQQILIAEQIVQWTGGRFLIVAPLNARHVFRKEAQQKLKLDFAIDYIRNDAEALAAASPIVITNYERVQSGEVTAAPFVGVTLDEGNYLRNLGSETTRHIFAEFMSLQYRFVATATPSPNRLKELTHYAEFLGVMDSSQAVTRWFKRNPKKAHDVRLHKHHEEEFWKWVATWALFITKPSDLGYSDEGYDLPPITVHWHRVPVDHARAWDQMDRDGQRRLILDGSVGVREAATEKRATLEARLAKMHEIMTNHPGRHWLLWHHLEDERERIEQTVPGVVTVYGSQTPEEKEERILGFEQGDFPVLATKPEIAGSGCNFQEHCADAIFLGVNYSFDDFIQAIHRLQRFGQEREVTIHIIFAESEESIVTSLKQKWREHDRLVAEMRRIMREYGLSREAIKGSLRRAIGVTRQVEQGRHYTAINNDCVLETLYMADDSVDFIITSEPFGDQYEYVASYNDFGHNEGNDGFFRQMDFLIPELLRVLKPGRVAAIHCKDRARVGKYSEFGIFNVEPFSDDTTRAFCRHGFVFAGRITIATDVVKENNQTYRLGWTEMCKDGSKMSVGMAEYILLFRKLPTDTANAYADEPVVKDKAVYTRGRWQIDAHDFWRSSGNRLLTPEEYAALEPAAAARLFALEQRALPYDYERHVAICEALDARGHLPSSFMLLPPQSPGPDVWTDVVYVRTLNTTQAQKGREAHVCPLPLDIVERCIERWSMPGEVVYDPFAGLFTVPYLAVKMGRQGLGVELNSEYWRAGLRYCEIADIEASSPTLFDLLDCDLEEAS